MEEPLVSILIPFKNTAKFLSECLESIQKQSYKNWEVLAVNDHSSDISARIAEGFAQQDGRIKVFKSFGQGIIPALQTAYAHSKGDFITRMDADDIMTPNKLKVLAASLLEKGMHHVAVGQVKYFSAKGISNGYRRYEVWLNKLTVTGNNYTEIYKECVIPSPCWMVHRKDLDACGAFQSERYPEDYDLAFRFYEKELHCISCDQILHHWRDYDTRTSRTSAHYAQNYFLDIKLYYFLKLEYSSLRPLVVWGAGNKGKTIAKSLSKQGVDFHWLCDNPNKIGKNIYGKQLLHFSYLEQLNSPQTIITVANESEQFEIKSFLKKCHLNTIKDYFFFC